MSRAKPGYRSCTECTFGYCAPNRCYCGHTECTAYASYINPYTQSAEIRHVPNTEQHAKSWAEREEQTWLDK